MSTAQMKLAHQVSGPAETSEHMVFDPAAEVGAVHQATSAAHRADAAAEELRESLARSELPREQMLQEIFAHFDEDRTGALDHAQALRLLQLLNAEVSLSEADWRELCESLSLDPAVGLPRGQEHFDTFFEEMDGASLRSVHGSVVAPDRGLQVGAAAESGAAAAEGGAAGGGPRQRESEAERTARLLASRAARKGSGRSPGM